MSENNWKAGESEEGLAPRDFPRGDAYNVGTVGEVAARGQRAELIRQMEADRAERGTRKGSPNRLARYDITASAKVYGLRALATIVEIMEDAEEAAPVRLAAAKEVLDRAFGRPKQITEIGGLDGDEIRNRLVIEFVGAGAGPLPSRVENRPKSEVDHRWNSKVLEEGVTQVEEVNRVGASGAVEPASDVSEVVGVKPSFVNPWAK